MSTKSLIFVGIFTVLTGVVVAYIVYKLGWNGGGGSATVDSPQTVAPTSAFGMKPTGGYIPGRVVGNVSLN